MSIPATQLRPGMIIKHNNDLHSVFSVEHRTPGNLRAFIQAKLRNLRTGAMFEHRFRSPDPIEKINVDEIEMEYLYNDGDSYYFMDTSNYEQTHLTKEILGDAKVKRIIIKDEKGKLLLSIPVTWGAAGAVAMITLAPWLAALGVIAGIFTRCRIEVEKSKET